MHKRRLVNDGKFGMVVAAQTLMRKRENALVDIHGFNWADYFWRLHCNHCCSQDGDYLGFTRLISMHFIAIPYLDICPCKIPKAKENPFPDVMREFVFPIVGLCKKLWTRKTLWKFQLDTPRWNETQEKMYQTPGQPDTWWVAYERNPLRAMHRPIEIHVANEMMPWRCADHNECLQISKTWEVDKMYAAKVARRLDFNREIMAILEEKEDDINVTMTDAPGAV